MALVISGTSGFSGVVKAPAFVPSGGTGDGKVCGYKNWVDASTAQTLAGDSTSKNIGMVSFTIPSTPGVSTWRVIAMTSVTGAVNGNRQWYSISLDTNYDNISYGGYQNTSAINSNGWSEHAWVEHDLSIPAYSAVATATWEGVTAGSHTVRCYQQTSHASNTIWRRGIAVHWYPSS